MIWNVHCYELYNIATDDIIFLEDKGKVKDWDKAQDIYNNVGFIMISTY